MIVRYIGDVELSGETSLKVIFTGPRRISSPSDSVTGPAIFSLPR